MEQINPYAVMRNTATFEAYRAYQREAMKAGQGLVFAAMILPAVWIPFQIVIGQHFRHARLADAPLFAAFLLAPVVLSVLLMAIGIVKIMRFRREHPVPDEWRQTPRASRPLVPGRKLRPL